ncbi:MULTISPECIES: tyrosine-type recombinase/integrase [unclassified Nonomuraea]|uniref:tyrosine-type recombinase/integrase n=1 Tax=unclassified Nonomuraea TaxID=2593643 RepID=UPI0033C32C4E
MASLIKKCECADTKAGRRLDLRKADDRKTAERVWGKCGHSWTVRYRLGGRGTKQQEQSYPHAMKRDAEAFILEIKSDKVSGLRRTIDPKAGSITFADYAAKWLTARITLAPSTSTGYAVSLKNRINPAIGHLPLNAITRQMIKDLIAGLIASGYAPGTIHNTYLVLNAIFIEAAKAELIGKSPVFDIELPEITQVRDFYVPTWTQITALADAMPGDWALTIWLMAGCGLRIGEARAVDQDCVMFGGRRLRVRQQVTQTHALGPLKHRKEGEHRDAPLPPFVNQRIAAHIDTHGIADDGLLFRGRRGRFIDNNTYRATFAKAVKAAGLPDDFTPHDLRHAYVSMQLASGIPITDVSRWIGHKNINITYAIYGHLVDESWDRALDVMQARFDATPISTAAAC